MKLSIAKSFISEENKKSMMFLSIVEDYVKDFDQLDSLNRLFSDMNRLGENITAAAAILDEYMRGDYHFKEKLEISNPSLALAISVAEKILRNKYNK